MKYSNKKTKKLEDIRTTENSEPTDLIKKHRRETKKIAYDLLSNDLKYHLEKVMFMYGHPNSNLINILKNIGEVFKTHRTYQENEVNNTQFFNEFVAFYS